jgi:hypothetical protein
MQDWEVGMKKYLIRHHLERGQILVIVAIMMFAIIAMVALILDGGALMSNRRTAQAAADAGALAGAQCICTGVCPGDSPEGTAKLYATNNGAKDDPDVSVADGEVTVLATVENTSFFAGIFGENNLTATAEAVAKCSPPSISNSPLPVAFYHLTPALNPGVPDEDPNTIGKYDFQTLVNLLKAADSDDLPLDDIYIIGDNVKVCDMATGELVCDDIDGFGGDRVWLDLSPLKDPPSNTGKIITDGLDRPLGDTPIWVNGDPGTESSSFAYIADIPTQPYDLGDLEAILLNIPLFDKVCDDKNCDYGDDNKIEGFKENSRSYRITGFGAFLVTCLRSSNSCEFGCVDGGCPGLGFVEFDGNNAFEGYWVYNSPLNPSDDLGGSDGDPGGILTITLIK